MSPSHGTVLFGKETIRFKLFFVDRKTMEIAVHPDKTVIVKAPEGANYTAVEQKVRKRARWINRQLDFFRQFDPRTPSRKYIGGETHLYLGRRYRIKIHLGQLNKVKLFQGFFQIRVKGDHSPKHIKRLMDALVCREGRVKIPGKL